VTVHVVFAPRGTSIEVPRGTTLLDAAIAAGMPVGSSCGADGICGKCGLRVLSGKLPAPSEREARVARANRVDEGLRLSCMVQLTEDLRVSADYW
jgi:ferredoxin